MGIFGGLVKGVLDTVLLPVEVVKDIVDEDRDQHGRTRTHRRVEDIGDDVDEVLEDLIP